MIINKDVYPDVSVGTYATVSNPVIDYDADEPLEHSIFYAGSISENVQFCDETNYTYNATAPNCQFSVTPKSITKADVFFLSRGFRFFNLNDKWEYRNDQTYNIVTEFDVSQFYFDMNQLTCQVYDISQPDGGHAIGSATNMTFNTYRNQTAEYKKTHLIRSVTCNYVSGDSTSFCKYKGVASYYDVNVSPMIRYVFNDKTTIYAPIILNSYGIPDWQGPSNLNTLTGSGNFPEYASDIYSNTYTQFGKWYDTFVPGGSAHLVTAANIGAVTDFTVHAGNDQGQQVNNGYHIPDISNINTDKYMIPVFIWGNSWNKRIMPFFTDEFLMRYIASFGLRFKVDNTMYIGYMNADGTCNGDYILESQLADSDSANRNITDFSGSNYDANIPYVPPSPIPSGDDPSDDQAWGGAYSGAGAFSKFYLCTQTDLANLRTWFGGGGSGDPIPDGFDPMGQVLGLLQYPISISGTALAPEEIIFRSGKTIVHTGVNADRSTGGFLHLDCGSVEIPRRMQERGVPFLDFETSLEIYVPFCGTAPLDVQTCVGQTLTCDMYVATATGDVSAVIAAGGHPVAYMSGNMAESLPISSSGYGMYLAACKSTWGNGVSQVMNQLTGGTVDTMKNVNQAALNETLSYGQTGGWGHSELIRESYNNPHVGNAMAAAASPIGAAAIGLIKTGLNVANAASTSYEQYQRVKHASYTSVSGSFTSCAAWNYPFTPYVKITRPHQQIPTGGRGDYKHTAAIPLVETKTLSGAPGLTTCVNPDVSGISNATAQEKDIIYRALVNGVIV